MTMMTVRDACSGSMFFECGGAMDWFVVMGRIDGSMDRWLPLLGTVSVRVHVVISSRLRNPE